MHHYRGANGRVPLNSKGNPIADNFTPASKTTLTIERTQFSVSFI